MSLYNFVAESNRIEGILRPPYDTEIDAHNVLLDKPALSVHALKWFVSQVQPNAVLRDREGLNVRVGDHVPPEGGPAMVQRLEYILCRHDLSTFEMHQHYEYLHPFTDGNGRSGRAIWLWMMSQQGQFDRAVVLGFLHNWYYQSLSEWRKP